MIINGSDFTALTGMSAIGYRDLMGESFRRRRRDRRKRAGKAEEPLGGESCENSCADSADFSDGAESTASSSSAASTSVLKDLNGVREVAGPRELRSDGGGFFCGFPFQKKVHSSPSNIRFRNLSAAEEGKA